MAIRRLYNVRRIEEDGMPTKPVEVLYNGVWCPGRIDHWGLYDGIIQGWLVRQPNHPVTTEPTWHASVTWRNPDDGFNYVDWVPASCVRPAAGLPETTAGPRPEPEPC